jgi:streptogramin lyase/phosphodiesterase/alkaline phosphatase D-like protein
VTVAIVGAFGYPEAENDLRSYRIAYGLPFCTTANGCFKKVNQKGETKNYPEFSYEWSSEAALDMDMVSAACPECKILLVEANSAGKNSNETGSLELAAQKAYELGANVISNSWGFKESAGDPSLNSYFNHPSTPSVAASGDGGYESFLFPASSPYVIAAGGTDLEEDTSSPRGWKETVASFAGSGCSAYQAKPSWQKDTGCLNRAVADVSAVANGVFSYDSERSNEKPGWMAVSGTSVSAPFIAGIEALKSSAFREAGAKAFYEAGNHHELYDVVKGNNGDWCTFGGCGPECLAGPGHYLCGGTAGYDGPSGMGTPGVPLAGPPATAEGATLLEPEEATLNGIVNPQGSSTTYTFEYGLTTAYGSTVPASPASAGSGAEAVSVAQKITGLKVSTKYNYRIVATNATGTFYSPNESFTTPAATTVGVLTEPASNLQVGAATLNGAINPGGAEATYQFEYGTTKSYGSSAPVPAKASGANFTTVSQAITGLKPNRIYHFRLKATQGATTAYGSDRVFRTPAGPPLIFTEPATHLDGTGATLNATIASSGGESTSYHFEYGATASYGKVAPASGSKETASGSDDVRVSEEISNLEPGTTYHFRLVAENAHGTTIGVDETFNTREWTTQFVGQVDARPTQLTAISCASTSACVAVGYNAVSGGTNVTLAEQRNSFGLWQQKTTPNPSGAKESRLEDVSTECIAVGYYTNSAGTSVTLAERWNGSAWSIQATPNPSGAKESRLEGVSCTSSSACTASGFYVNSSGATLTLAERWNGSEWLIQATPNPASAAKAVLHDVSCAAANDCEAVGESAEAGKEPTSLAERWNGSEWTILPMSQPMKYLTAVSCSSTTWCVAVGDGLNLERWGGAKWLKQEAPSPGKSAMFTGVFCSSSSACNAVGSYENEGTAPFAEHWGTAPGMSGEWALQSTTDPLEGPSPQASTLESVSCETSSACTAVGYYVKEGEYGNSYGNTGLAEAHLAGKAPSASTEAATNVGGKKAALNATVNPNGEDTTYQFEYGTTTSYGTATSIESVGSGATALKVGTSISSLTTGTTYHFRIVATNSKGAAVGQDEIFKTQSLPQNTALPVATPATPAQAVPESTTTGTWTESPSYAFQWRRCNASGGECADISGATKSTYTPVEADIEHTLVAKVTATNSVGSASASTSPTGKVRPIGQVTEYALPVGSRPIGITADPGENLWFTTESTDKIGKITTSGTITEYALPTNSDPTDITFGPDNKLWFTNWGTSKIGKITTTGTATEYALPVNSFPFDITAGPDGNLWFVTWSTGLEPKVGKITTTGTITQYALPKESEPSAIIAGPDGNLWFANRGTSKIGKATTTGSITEYPLPAGSRPGDIAVGPDGNLWFTDESTSKIGKITTTGTVTEYGLAAKSNPAGIVTASDGNLWFTEGNASKIGRITTSGTVTTYSLAAESWPFHIATGPDGMLWFTNWGTSKIGTIAP